MKKSFLIASLFIFLLILAGCKEKNASQEEEKTEETVEIADIQNQVKRVKEQVEKLKLLTDIQFESINGTMNQLLYKDEQLNHILKYLPNVERKHGYIEQLTLTDPDMTIRVQLVDMVDDNTAPNNYRLDTLEVVNLTMNTDALIYTLEGVEPVKNNSIDEFTEKIREYERLFIFTMVNDKVVFISEQYLP